jgi:hypothetical protein
MSEEVNTRETVDLVWSIRPTGTVWKRIGKKKEKVIFSKIPTILRDIGPEHVIDFSGVEAELQAGTGTAEPIKVEKKSGKASKALIEANTVQMEDDKFSRDMQRILNKTQEGMTGLLGIRKSIDTSRGHLRLLLEILKLSSSNQDKASAYDVLWAIQASEAFKTYELETQRGPAGGAIDAGGAAAAPVGGAEGKNAEQMRRIVFNEPKIRVV